MSDWKTNLIVATCSLVGLMYASTVGPDVAELVAIYGTFAVAGLAGYTALALAIFTPAGAAVAPFIAVARRCLALFAVLVLARLVGWQLIASATTISIAVYAALQWLDGLYALRFARTVHHSAESAS